MRLKLDRFSRLEFGVTELIRSRRLMEQAVLKFRVVLPVNRRAKIGLGIHTTANITVFSRVVPNWASRVVALGVVTRMRIGAMAILGSVLTVRGSSLMEFARRHR